jgi:hypothetical protein
VTHRGRLQSRFGAANTNAFMLKLDELANNPAVNGVVVDLNVYPEVVAAYNVWQQDTADPSRANYTAATIKALLATLRTAYPNLQYLVIAGDDDIIPFYRVPDEATVSNEFDYYWQIDPVPNSPVAAAMWESYFFSDDFYVSYEGMVGWRGRNLYLPDLAVGRLVEEPAQMTSPDRRFSGLTSTPINNGLVVGYDFVIDQANAIVAELVEAGLNPIP